MEVSLKAQLRIRIKKAMADLSESTRKMQSADMVNKVIARPAYIRASQVSIFLSMPEEIQTRDLLMAAFSHGKLQGTNRTA